MGKIEKIADYLLLEDLVKFLYKITDIRVNILLLSDLSFIEQLSTKLKQINTDITFSEIDKETEKKLEKFPFLEVKSSFLNEYFENNETWATYSSGRKIMQGDDMGYFLSLELENSKVKIKPVLFCSDEIKDYSISHLFSKELSHAIDQADEVESIIVLIKMQDFKKPKI